MSSTRKEVIKQLAKEGFREQPGGDTLVHEATGITIGMVNNIHGRGAKNIITEAVRMARNAKTHNPGFIAWLMKKHGVEPGETAERDFVLRPELVEYLNSHGVKGDDLPQLINSVSQYARVNGYLKVLRRGATRGGAQPSTYQLTAPAVHIVEGGGATNGNGLAADHAARPDRTVRARGVETGMVVSKVGKPEFRVTQISETDAGFKTLRGVYLEGGAPAVITVPPDETLTRYPPPPATAAIGTAVPDTPGLEVGQDNNDGRLVPDIHRATRDQIDVTNIGQRLVASAMLREAEASVALDGETQSVETQRRPDDVLTGRTGALVTQRPEAPEPAPVEEPPALTVLPESGIALPADLVIQLREAIGAEDRTRLELVQAAVVQIEATALNLRRAAAMVAEFEAQLAAQLADLRTLFE